MLVVPNQMANYDDKKLMVVVSVPQRLTRFEYDTSYAPMNTSEFFTDEVLDKWNDLMPSEQPPQPPPPFSPKWIFHAANDHALT